LAAPSLPDPTLQSTVIEMCKGSALPPPRSAEPKVQITAGRRLQRRRAAASIDESRRRRTLLSREFAYRD